MIFLIQACLNDHIDFANFVKLHNVFENSRCVTLTSHELQGFPTQRGYIQLVTPRKGVKLESPRMEAH